MARFQQKPVEAWQWNGTRESAAAINRACGGGFGILCQRDDGKTPRLLEVPTNGPQAYAAVNDWIIRFPSGALTFCPPTAFDALYDRLPEST